MTAQLWVELSGQAVLLVLGWLGYRSTRAKQEETHKLVNNQLDRQLIYNQQLSGALVNAGVDVPEQELPGHGEAGERTVS